MSAVEVRTDSKNGTPVASPCKVIEVFQTRTQARIVQWTEQLQQTPDRFVEIEQEIDQHYRQGVGHLVASLLAKVTEEPRTQEHVEGSSGGSVPGPTTSVKARLRRRIF